MLAKLPGNPQSYRSRCERYRRESWGTKVMYVVDRSVDPTFHIVVDRSADPTFCLSFLKWHTPKVYARRIDGAIHDFSQARDDTNTLPVSNAPFLDSP